MSPDRNTNPSAAEVEKRFPPLYLLSGEAPATWSMTIAKTA
jgi:hypothetical protein